jgi:hypothetical protein
MQPQRFQGFGRQDSGLDVAVIGGVTATFKGQFATIAFLY